MNLSTPSAPFVPQLHSCVVDHPYGLNPRPQLITHQHAHEHTHTAMTPLAFGLCTHRLKGSGRLKAFSVAAV